jgi:hypothetical protein
MNRFRVWAPDDGDEPAAPNVAALDEEMAALSFVEHHHADLDYPSEVLVSVKDEDGHHFELLVVAEQDVSFRIGALE